MIASTASVIRNKAESAPIVISVPHMSLSMEPTIPAMKMDRYFSANAWSILPFRVGHRYVQIIPAAARWSGKAPVSTDHHQCIDPRLIRFWTAWRRPLWSGPSDRAGPLIEVPPFCNIPPPADHPAFECNRPPGSCLYILRRSYIHRNPQDGGAHHRSYLPVHTLRIPPLVRTAIDFICHTNFIT